MKENNLAKNTILLSIGTILNKGLIFLMIPIFSKWLSIDEYGNFDLLCTYITMLIPILSLSAGDGMFRYGVEKRGKDKKIYITSGLILYLIGIIFFGICLFIINIFINKFILVPFYLMLICEYFNNYLQYYLRTIKKLNVYSFTSIISTVVTFLVVTILVKFFNYGLYGIIYGYSFGYLIANIVIIIFTQYFNYLTLKINKNYIKDIINFSIPLVLNNISWWIVNASDRTIINIFLNSTANGIYAIAYKIPNFCSSVFSVFGIAWQETAIDTINFKNRKKYYSDVFNKMLILITSLCLMLLAFNFAFFEFVFDNKYYSGGMYAPILITSIIFSTISQFYGGIQISLKQSKNNGISTVFGAIVNIIVHLLLIKYIGLYAAALSTLISSITITIIRIKMVNKGNDLIEFNKKYISLMFIYIFEIFVAYLYSKLPIYLNIINLIFCCLIFAIYNKEYIIKITNKILRKK